MVTVLLLCETCVCVCVYVCVFYCVVFVGILGVKGKSKFSKHSKDHCLK